MPRIRPVWTAKWLLSVELILLTAALSAGQAAAHACQATRHSTPNETESASHRQASSHATHQRSAKYGSAGSILTAGDTAVVTGRFPPKPAHQTADAIGSAVSLVNVQ